jgi:AAA15 family ATPase/GTPase
MPAFNWIAQELIVLAAGTDLNPFLSLELLRRPDVSKEFIGFMQAAGIDRSLHPYITRFLVTLLSRNKNTKAAQLIFTTHDTTLLDANLLRRDQIWFVEKDAEQSTKLYPLLDYRPRKDEALERGYMKGRYGDFPMFGKISRLLGGSIAGGTRDEARTK